MLFNALEILIYAPIPLALLGIFLNVYPEK